MTKTADFETGTNGSQVNTTDTGSLTAFTGQTGTKWSYDTTHVYQGTLAAKIAAAGGAGYMSWTVAGAPADDYGRMYVYFTSVPSSADIIFLSQASGNNSKIGFTSAGKLLTQDNSNSSSNGSVTVANGQWVRLEYHILHDASAGIIEVKLFNTASSTTPSDTVTFTGRSSGAGSTLDLAGNFTGSPGTDWWIDNLVMNAAAYPGPFPVNTVAPAVSGSTTVGSVLTCDGGTWNGGATFTLTYQWTRDGSNIGSATSSTYTTVTADGGHAIGCTVTATGVVATNESASLASGNTISVAAPASGGGTGTDPGALLITILA